MNSYGKKLARLLSIVVILSVPVLVWTQRWNIYDSWRLRGYQPEPAVAQLAKDTTMNDRTRRLFYVYHPDLQDSLEFNDSCRTTELTIVLGCYVSGTGIYLFNVTDERLAGVQQVTAAHETLHAAYDRLSGSDKATVIKLLNQAYSKVTDERILSTMEDYRKNGADVTNELHSILGTEVRDLTPELEQYYRRYFISRLKIVEYSEKYEQAFTERLAKVAQYDKTLADIKRQLDSGQADLVSREQTLKNERNRLNGLLAAKEYEAYNAGVGSYNALVNAYNAQVGRVRGLIDQYNAIVAARNAIAAEESELVKAIDSRPTTIEQQ